jgi:ParB family transcriptional regulator, chromosome partitioning protein
VHEIHEIEISRIRVFDGRRVLNANVVDALARSIEDNGLHYPIDLYQLKGILNGNYGLIAGAHRLAAFEKLGRTTIPAKILSRQEKSAWQELENLLRAELTVLERSEALAALATKFRGKRATSGGGAQPQDRGISEVERLTGYSRKLITEALLHISIPAELRRKLKDSRKHDDNRSLLTKIARTQPEDQASIVEELVSPSPAPAKNSERRAASPSFRVDGAVKRLTAAWLDSEFRIEFEKETMAAQRAFLDSLLGQ